MRVAVLFARKDSNYKRFRCADVWDKERNALNWPGGCPVVAHPPCRAWGRLRHFAKPEPGEKELALWAVDQVRAWGGVLEHPEGSSLWPAAGLPKPGDRRDEFGGFSLTVDQHWWGHRARKRTWLYIVGVDRSKVPAIQPTFLEPEFVVSPKGGLRKGMPGWKPHIRKDEREHTPPAFAEWLLELARRCGQSGRLGAVG